LVLAGEQKYVETALKIEEVDRNQEFTSSWFYLEFLMVLKTWQLQ
jgi:hypothetical protein